MKKYFAAAIVAVMVFAFSAFAADLTVTSGPLQAGVDTELSCYDEALVSYATGYNQTVSDEDYDPEQPFEVVAVTVTFVGEGDIEGGCPDDARAHIKINDGDTGSVGPHGYAIGEIDGDTFTAEVDGDKTLLVEDVNQVQVMVKNFANEGEQAGFLSGVFAPQPTN